MFDALSETYTFDVDNFQSLDQITLGYDSVMCSVITGDQIPQSTLKEKSHKTVPEVTVTEENIPVENVPKTEEMPKVQATPEVQEAIAETPSAEEIQQSVQTDQAQKEEIRKIVDDVNTESLKTYGYKGKNYDPDYIKKKYGAEYNPKRDKKRTLRAFQPREYEVPLYKLKHKLGPELWVSKIIFLDKS